MSIVVKGRSEAGAETLVQRAVAAHACRVLTPDDRRVTMVHRTADGDALRTTMAAAALNELAGLNDLNDDELHTLNTLLGRFVD